jgi:hypothetical protein
MALGSFRGNGIFSFALLATATLGGAATAHQAVDPAILALIRPGESLVGVGKPDLIERGRRLFTEETFGGNGRTCASCHPPDNNFTLDPAFIATLPRRDPLFVAEFDPRLRALENPAMLRRFALVLENLDGFGQPGVLRSVPHTLGLGQTIAPDTASGFPLAGATGWSGDGAPGNGSLRNFAVGAVVQHATKSLAREPGKDFRLPTEAELDMMLAFCPWGGKPNSPRRRPPTSRTARSTPGGTCSSARRPCGPATRGPAPARAATASPAPTTARAGTSSAPRAPTGTRTRRPAAATPRATAGLDPHP